MLLSWRSRRAIPLARSQRTQSPEPTPSRAPNRSPPTSPSRKRWPSPGGAPPGEPRCASRGEGYRCRDLTSYRCSVLVLDAVGSSTHLWVTAETPFAGGRAARWEAETPSAKTTQATQAQMLAQQVEENRRRRAEEAARAREQERADDERIEREQQQLHARSAQRRGEGVLGTIRGVSTLYNLAYS